MTDKQLQELSDLATKAISVGTWSAYGPALIGVNADDPKGEEEAIDIVPECFESEYPFMFYANCQYIAAACNAVPSLIADYRRLRELERAVGAIRAEYKSEVWQALEKVYALRKEEQALHDERTHLMAAYLQAWREGYRKGRADHLQELEVAVRGAMRKLPLGSGWVWKGDSVDIAAIGRLLEGEE